MSDTEERNVAEDDNLFKQLRLDPFDSDIEQLDGNAIIKELKENPQAAASIYKFPGGFNGFDQLYPLHQAVRLGAKLDVVEAIYNCYPPAMREKCEGFTALLRSFECFQSSYQYEAATDVMLFLISKWPDALREKDTDGDTDLQIAFRGNAPFKVLSTMLDVWPDGAKERNNRGDMLLHGTIHPLVYYDNPIETVSLILKHHPCALKEKNNNGSTPLHIASYHSNVPSDLIQFLVEKYPEATAQKDKWGFPFEIYGDSIQDDDEEEFPHEFIDEYIRQVLLLVYQLYSGNELGSGELKEIMDTLIDMHWWNGVLLLIDRYPTFIFDLDIDDKAFPQILHVIGQRCTMKTFWKVVRNKLDIIEIVGT